MKNKRPEYDMKAIGQRLKYYREKRDLTVEAVRQYLCLSSVQAIYKWEKGTSLPTLDNFMALTELYHVDPQKLMVKQEKEREYVLIECCGRKNDYMYVA